MTEPDLGKKAPELANRARAERASLQAVATVKSSAMEAAGFSRRHLVVCGTEGPFHSQPLDDPAVQLALSAPRGDDRAGLHDVTFPKYFRYVGDAAERARIIRGEKESDFPYSHDPAVQRTMLRACALPLDR